MCCPLSAGDGDAPEFFVESTPRARKEHRCSECREAITPLQKHLDACRERIAGLEGNRKLVTP